MIIEALGQAALRTLLLIATVQLGLWLLRIKRAQLLLIVWTIVLAASLAMPALQWATPLRIPAFPQLPDMALASDTDAQRQPSVLEAPAVALAADIKEPARMMPWLGAVYALVCSVLLLRLTVGIALSLRLLAEAAPVRLGWAENGRIRISRHVAAPVTVANVILLPADAVDWSAAMRRAVLAHEHSHVARWDFAMLVLSQVNRALFWFSPLSWWLHRRLVALAELASDEQAIEITGDRSGYAEILLLMGRRTGPVLRGLAMARPATLRYRIERILSERARPAPVSPRQQVVLVIGAVGFSIAAASSDFNPATPPYVPVLAELQTQTTPSPSVQAAEDVPKPIVVSQPQTETAMNAPHRIEPSVPLELPTAIAQSHPDLQGATHPQSNPIARKPQAAQPSRVARQSTASTNARVALVASRAAKPVNSGGILPPVTVDPDQTNRSDGDIDEDRPRRPSHPIAYALENDRPVLRLINNKTCTGVYMPEHAATLAKKGLNMVPAILLRDASDFTFLTFFFGEQKPLVQPVIVKQERDRLTKIPNTVFTMLPTAARYLNGFIKRPFGRIDFDCGGSDVHPLDGGG